MSEKAPLLEHRRTIPKGLIAALASVSFLASGCFFRGEDQAKPPDTATVPASELDALHELNAPLDTGQAQVTDQVFMVPGGRIDGRYVGGTYYDAPNAASTSHTIPDHSYLEMNTPRPLDDQQDKVHWWAFTLAPDSARKSFEDPNVTYWLPLKFDPQLQPGAVQPNSRGWGIFAHNGVCNQRRAITETPEGNLVVAGTDERVGVGQIISDQDYASKLAAMGLKQCAGNAAMPP